MHAHTSRAPRRLVCRDGRYRSATYQRGHTERARYHPTCGARHRSATVRMHAHTDRAPGHHACTDGRYRSAPYHRGHTER
eukprot:1742953-Prorocentrum_lima.AAC.1